MLLNQGRLLSYYNKFVIIVLFLQNLLDGMEIKYYENSRSDNEIADFIYEVKDKKSRDAIVNKIKRLRDIGHYRLQASNEVEKIKIKNNLYELKISGKGIIYRILFALILNYYYLALIFIKKDQKTRKKYIELADKRIKKREKYEKQENI